MNFGALWRRLATAALALGIAVGATPGPVRALADYFYMSDGDSTLEVEMLATPQWTLVTDGGKTTYSSAVMDRALLGHGFRFEFRDRTNIRRNGEAVDARLRGANTPRCRRAFFTFKDLTNRRKIAMSRPGDAIESDCGFVRRPDVGAPDTLRP